MKRVLLLVLLGSFHVLGIAQVDDESAKLVHLIVEDGKLVASNVKFSRFDELKLNARERIIEQAVGDAAIVVITNQRIIGYGVFSGFRSLKTETGERFTSVEAEDFSALVVSNKRFLNFNGKSGVWGERKRP